MSPESIIALAGASVAFLSIAYIIFRKLPRRLKSSKFKKKWRDLQKLCASKETWPQAIENADTLVNHVLKKKRVNGKTMGERLVAARVKFSDNDALWRAHKLAEHIRHSQSQMSQLSENDVKEALVAFRQALKDLKAL